jgi:hypothetical protein
LLALFIDVERIGILANPRESNSIGSLDLGWRQLDCGQDAEDIEWVRFAARHICFVEKAR